MRQQIAAFETAFNKFTLFLASLVAASIGLIALLVPLNLALVKVELGGIWWLYEAVEYTLYVGVFIGAPWVLQQGAHVRVDVLVTALSRPQAVRLERVVDAAATVLCLFLFYYGCRAAISEFEDGTLPDKDLRIANWYMLAVFALSFLLLAIEFLFRMRRATAIAQEDYIAKSGF